MISIIVVDDQAMLRGALATLLNLEDDISVVGQAASGAEALDLLAHLARGGTSVDVALLDVEMPELDGIGTARRISAEFPDTASLIVTTFGRPGYVQRALSAGALGFIVKDTPVERLAAAIRQVAAGERVIDPQLAVDSMTRGTSPLTERETDVLRAALDGATIEDIAAALHLSTGTVRNHVSSAMTKTKARTRSEAAHIARESGWL
ncbi:response regulator transcription factor [Bowdeniella massiliensis]|uniref:response regulator transcription factor n=1 Tax=Bowdeniella massiliensis TaxID=2932264 RepID=UPI0020287867|nr:response regulator transcription factor [Bowdeniella massiliensis]